MRLQIKFKEIEVKKTKKKIQEPIWFTIALIILVWNIVDEIIALATHTCSAWNFADGFFVCFFLYELNRVWRGRK